MKTNYSEFLEQTMERIGNYGKANPDFMGAFFNLRQAAGKPGVLSSKHKDLIALGISINAKCEGCIAMHTSEALKHGATEQEIIETIATAIYMGGGPSVVFGAKAYDILKEFESVNQKQLITNN